MFVISTMLCFVFFPQVGPDNQTCVKCESPFTSNGADAKCDFCVDGYYVTDDGSCKPCPDFATCKEGDTLATIRTNPGYWRSESPLSPTLRFYRSNSEACLHILQCFFFGDEHTPLPWRSWGVQGHHRKYQQQHI